MGFIAWIVVGLIAGWLAEQIAGREHGLLTNLVVGVVGALVGGFVFGSILGFRYDAGVATGGAVLFLWVWGMIRGRGAGPVYSLALSRLCCQCGVELHCSSVRCIDQPL